MKQKLLKAWICAGAVAVLSTLSVRAQVSVYNSFANGYNGTSLSMTNGLEIGNEITPPSGGSLTGFTIEYDAPNTLAANVAVDVRFYYNNVPYPTYPTINQPGALFFDSGWFLNTAAGLIQSGPQAGTGDTAYDLTYNTSDFSAGAQNGWFPNFTVPGDFTFTITWTNLTGTSEIYMPLANNTAGISGGEYWENNGGSWGLMTNSLSGPANFLADFEVPEPQPFGLAAIGGAMLLAINKLRRKR